MPYAVWYLFVNNGMGKITFALLTAIAIGERFAAGGAFIMAIGGILEERALARANPATPIEIYT